MRWFDHLSRILFSYGPCDKCGRRHFLSDVRTVCESFSFRLLPRQTSPSSSREIFKGRICNGCWNTIQEEKGFWKKIEKEVERKFKEEFNKEKL